MPFFKKRPRTAQQKAQRTQMRIFAKLACCAYIVFYVIIPLLRAPAEEESMSPELRYGISAAFIVAVAVIAVLTVREIVLFWKAGLFTADAYEDDEEAWSVPSKSEALPEEGEDNEGDDNEDDESEDDESME